MKLPAADLAVLSELIQQLALSQAANNQAAGADGGAAPTPAATATASAATTAAPAQVAGHTNTAPNANTATLGYFRCPNCDIIHPLSVALDVVANSATDNPGLPSIPATPATIPATPTAGLFTAPATPVAGLSTNNGGSWYSVTRGRQVSMFQGWDNIVCALVQGVPRWRCKRFATEQQARIHYNHALMMNDIHVHTDE